VAGWRQVGGTANLQPSELTNPDPHTSLKFSVKQLLSNNVHYILTHPLPVEISFLFGSCADDMVEIKEN